MFGIGGTEFIIIAVIALLLFGPEKLPTFGRTIGRFLRDFKRYQEMMEATIRAEMYAAEGESSEKSAKPDAFAKGKDFRERVQAQKAAAAKAAKDDKAADKEQEPAPAEADSDGSTESQPAVQAEPEPGGDGDGEGERPVSEEA